MVEGFEKGRGLLNLTPVYARKRTVSFAYSSFLDLENQNIDSSY